MLRVDVLVVGGGIQGLLVLRRLTEAGYSCLLVTQGELGAGQTLHSHGLLNSGTGLVTGEMQAELGAHVLPALRSAGVPVYGHSASYLALPTAAVEQLMPLWEANGYHPQPLEAADLPSGLRLPSPLHGVPGYHVPKRALVRALADGLLDRIVQGHVTSRRERYDVWVSGTSEPVDVEARATVVAAGCGTKRFVRDALHVDAQALDRIGYVKTHMLCLRSPIGVLPSIGTVVTPDLVVVGHVNGGHDEVGNGDQVAWYVTPGGGEPQRYEEAPEEATAKVEPAVVARGVAALRQLVAALGEDDERIEATVFAGYKQDVDGQMTRSMFELVDGERSVFVALPSVLVNAWPNARQAVDEVRRLRAPAGTAERFRPVAPAVGVGTVNELREGVRWQRWRAFAIGYGG